MGEYKLFNQCQASHPFSCHIYRAKSMKGDSGERYNEYLILQNSARFLFSKIWIHCDTIHGDEGIMYSLIGAIFNNSRYMKIMKSKSSQ